MAKLTPAQKRRITSDWLSVCVGLGHYRPMHILRRNGSIVHGFLLERTSSNDCYQPMAHLHCLLDPTEYVGLTAPIELRTPRKNAVDYIDVDMHAERFESAARDLIASWTLPIQGDILLDQVVDTYSNFIEARGPKFFCLPEYEEMALTCASVGEVKRALAIVQSTTEKMRLWPEDVIEDIGSVESWKERMMVRVQDTDALERTMRDQIEALGVDKLPTGNIVV